MQTKIHTHTHIHTHTYMRVLKEADATCGDASRLFVLNRSALHNYVQDITADMLIQVEGSYLILRPPGSSSVVGMWFYKDGEHAAVSLLVQSIVQYLADNPAAPAGGGTPGRPGRPPLPQQQQQQQQRAVSSNDAGAALMGLLGQGTAPQSPPMTGASDTLKGMLGIAQPQGEIYWFGDRGIGC